MAFHLRNTIPRYITVGSLALLATVIYVLLVRDGFSGYEAFIMVAAIGSCALLRVRYLAGYSAVMVLSKMTRAQDEVGHESRITASEEIALRICLVPLAIAIVCTAGIAALISVSDMEERVASIPLALCVVLCYSKFVLLGRKAVLYRFRQQLANLSGGERE